MNLKQLERILELTDQISEELSKDYKGSYRVRMALNHLVETVEAEIGRKLLFNFKRGRKK